MVRLPKKRMHLISIGVVLLLIAMLALFAMLAKDLRIIKPEGARSERSTARINLNFQKVLESLGIKTGKNPAIAARPESNLVAWWSFDEESNDVADHSGNNRMAQLQGDEIRWINGVEGKALEFDGKSTWIDGGDDESFRFENSDFSIDLWARLTNDGNFGVLLGKGTPLVRVENPGFELVHDNRDVKWAAGLAFGVSDGKSRRTISIPKDPWSDGQWHRLIVSHAWEGQTMLWVDGVKKGVAGTKLEAGIGTNAHLCLGRRWGNEQWFAGALDEVRIFNRALGDDEVKRMCGPQASALKSNPASSPDRAIDGSILDESAWTGIGAPNWFEISLPLEQSIARIVLYPGDRRLATYPSTECSPSRLVIQGFVDGNWKDLISEISIPAFATFSAVRPDNEVVIDIPPTLLKRFRISISELQDQGKRTSGKTAPAEERGVIIREVRWQTTQELEEGRKRVQGSLTRMERELGSLRERLKPEGNGPTAAFASVYGAKISNLVHEVRRLDTTLDFDRLPGLERSVSNMSAMLAPWTVDAMAGKTLSLAEWHGAGSAGLVVDVSGANAGHARFPLSLPIDLEILERWWGVELDPWDIQVYALNPVTGKFIPFESGNGSGNKQRCPSRFDRIAPKRGVLKWVMKDDSTTRFLIVPGPKTNLPAPAGMMSLGDGDRLYYDKEIKYPMPWDISSSFFLDWDGDGQLDLLTGFWADYVHFWRNLGTTAQPLFSDREHFRLRDEDENLIMVDPERPALAFSYVIPVDVDHDGLEDLFITSIAYGPKLVKFRRNLGPRKFPVLGEARNLPGLERGFPAFGDLDGDGFIDAVVTASIGGKNVCLFQRGGLNAEKTPVFSAAVPLEGEGLQKYFPESTRRLVAFGRLFAIPSLFDVDGDGDLDLTYYTGDGPVYLSENKGTSTKAAFAAPNKIEAGGKPIDIGSYFNSAIWNDANGDGKPDLVCSIGTRVYYNVGTRKNFRLEALPKVPTLSGQRVVSGAHVISTDSLVDWNGDGYIDRVMTRLSSLDLEVAISRGGYFQSNVVVEVDRNKDDWFGCPDPPEYNALYTQSKLVDIDGDGDLDLFINSEHSWRFGYIHYYKNIGNGRFGPEQEFRPGGDRDWAKFIPGKTGQGIQVDTNTILDYLSYPTAGNFNPAGGHISFWFKPNWDSSDTNRHVFFSTEKNPNLTLSPIPLMRYYNQTQEGLALPPGFELLRTEKGTICLQRWNQRTESAPLMWTQDAWVRIEASWGQKGAKLLVDGKIVAEDAQPVAAGEIGRRIFIGSHPVLYVQRLREDPERYRLHPIDWIHPAGGAFDEFEISDAEGKSLLSLAFDGNCDGRAGQSGSRLRVSYRCAPDFADLNGDGLLDMVMVIGDGLRFQNCPYSVSSLGRGVLTFFPNIGTKGHPKFGKGIPLTSEGKIFRAQPVTQVTLVDWDGDGVLDLFLSTQNTKLRPEDVYNQAVDYFKNEGTKTAPRFGKRVRQQAIIDRIQPWHDVKMATADLDGDGRPDLEITSDNGTFFFSYAFLHETPPQVQIKGFARKP